MWTGMTRKKRKLRVGLRYQPVKPIASVQTATKRPRATPPTTRVRVGDGGVVVADMARDRIPAPRADPQHGLDPLAPPEVLDGLAVADDAEGVAFDEDLGGAGAG